MKTIPLALAIAAILLVAQGLLDRNERATTARIEYQRWVKGACLPTAPGDSVVIVSDGRQMRCRIYSQLARGREPIVVSSSVMEAPTW